MIADAYVHGTLQSLSRRLVVAPVAHMTVRTALSTGSSKRHDRELRWNSQVHLPHGFEATLRHEAVVSHRLRVAKVALEPVPSVDAVRAAHAMHEIGDSSRAARTAHVLASMRSALSCSVKGFRLTACCHAVAGAS